MNDLIITISREFGSGGRKIGEEVAKKLGINYFDKEIIDKAAQNSGLSPEFIEKEEQTFSNSILFNLATSGGQFGVGGTSLVVYPAAGLIDYFRGKNLVLINKSSTSADNKADLVIHEAIGKVLGEAVNNI